MSAADPSAIVLGYIEEVLNTGNQEAVDAFIDPTYIRHDPGLPFTVQGTDGIRQLMGAFRTAFPDLHVASQAVIADGDQVALYLLVTGTNRGELMGMPPTGKPISMGSIEIYRVAGGKIVEQWVVVDNAAMLRQLGVGG